MRKIRVVIAFLSKIIGGTGCAKGWSEIKQYIEEFYHQRQPWCGRRIYQHAGRDMSNCKHSYSQGLLLAVYDLDLL